MKTIKGYIDESLFGGADAEERASSLNNSLKLSYLPKTPQEYLNYMCAWNKIHNAVYNMKTESGELLAYIFRIYS